MRADIHDGPEHNTLQSEAGYIDARPLTASSTKTLATHGRTIHLGQSLRIYSVSGRTFVRCCSNRRQNLVPSVRPRTANAGLMHRSKQQPYSITSSAMASTDPGTARPRVFAVLRFITSSSLVGRTTGRSAGFSPLRMRPE